MGELEISESTEVSFACEIHGCRETFVGETCLLSVGVVFAR
jgi:hypothetical protein